MTKKKTYARKEIAKRERLLEIYLRSGVADSYTIGDLMKDIDEIKAKHNL